MQATLSAVWIPLTLAALAQGTGRPKAVQEAMAIMAPRESTDLLPGTKGSIILWDMRRIKAISLPETHETIVRPEGPTQGPTIHSLSGPDRDGRIAFIEDHVPEKHVLKVIQLNGTGERSIFERKGDAGFDSDGDQIGDHLALAPTGGLIALVADLTGLQLGEPGAETAQRRTIGFRGPDEEGNTYLGRGQISIWSVDAQSALPVSAPALDEAVCWFPDGKHIAYVDVLDNAQAMKLLHFHVPSEEEFGKEWSRWPLVPVVFMLDTATGERRALHPGQHPIVSPNGRDLLVRDFARRWRLLDLEQQVSRPFEAVGRVRCDAIVFVDPSLVFYSCEESEDSEYEWKLMHLTEGTFQNVAFAERMTRLGPMMGSHLAITFGEHDPRALLSFGIAER